jgi:hypothetical protein
LFPHCNRAGGGYLYAEIYYRSEDAEITVARAIRCRLLHKRSDILIYLPWATWCFPHLWIINLRHLFAFLPNGRHKISVK